MIKLLSVCVVSSFLCQAFGSNFFEAVRPQPPHHRYTCYAKDENGHSYIGHGRTMSSARVIALQHCEDYSHSCQIDHCYRHALEIDPWSR